MPIDAVVGHLEGVDAPRRIVEQDVNPVCVLRNPFRNLGDGGPVREIKVKPGRPVRRILPELLRNGLVCSICDLLVYANDKELLDALVEERVRRAVADALGSTGHNSDLAAKVWHVLERETAENRGRGGVS